MRRLLNIFLILSLSLSFSASLFGQLSGDGSSSNPFYGTISSSLTWDWENIGAIDGKIYIGTSSNPDLTITSGGYLTILPGATLVFTQLTSDLFITGTGRIIADGTPGFGTITFTKASGNDNWGHISLDNLSATDSTIFDYCTFTYGNVKNKSGSSGYGGAIHANLDKLRISNSTFESNTSEWGGALFVNQNRGPIIKNCYFSNNASDNGGGGIYCWNGSSANITNCIFEENKAGYGTSTVYYSGGGVSLQSSTFVKLTNCTFVNNDSNHDGDALQFYGSGSPNAKNCIFWGSSSQIVGGTATRLTNCAIQESTTGTNTINLNPSNSSSDGPNFNEIDGSDWSIKFISPCLDAGTDTGAPATDLNGNSRIGLTDIGAYEVQYSRWTGASGSSWSTPSNWDKGLTPSSPGSDIIIPSVASNYPTTTGTNYTIGNGKYFILEPGSKATFSTLTNSGGFLRHLSDATGIASLIFDSYSDAGTEEFEMFLTGGSIPDNKWHYIAVPGTMSKTTFTNINPYNLLEFDDSQIVDSNMEGWQWHDGYDGTNSFSTLYAKKGYNFYHSSDTTAVLPTMTGLLSTMGSSVSLQYNGNGLNLLGNSLTCSLNWDNVTTSGDMRDAIYFTKDNAIASYVDGAGTNGGTSIIPPLQGFFVKALEAGCSIDFTGAGVKTHGSVNRYKGGASTVPLVRITLDNDINAPDETVVRLRDYATTDFDNEYDASKMFSDDLDNPLLFTQIANEKYSINSIEPPYENYSVPLIVKISSSGDYSLERTELTGMGGYDVFLRDMIEDISINLEEIASYNFNSSSGTIDNRFVLEFVPLALGFEDIENNENPFKAYSYGGILNIVTKQGSSSGSATLLSVYDLTGRVVMQVPDLYFSGGETLQFGFNQPNGLYIVELRDGIKRTTQKFVHK